MACGVGGTFGVLYIEGRWQVSMHGWHGRGWACTLLSERVEGKARGWQWRRGGVC